MPFIAGLFKKVSNRDMSLQSFLIRCNHLSHHPTTPFCRVFIILTFLKSSSQSSFEMPHHIVDFWMFPQIYHIYFHHNYHHLSSRCCSVVQTITFGSTQHLGVPLSEAETDHGWGCDSLCVAKVCFTLCDHLSNLWGDFFVGFFGLFLFELGYNLHTVNSPFLEWVFPNTYPHITIGTIKRESTVK